MKTEHILIGGAALLLLATKGKIGGFVGETIGRATGGAASGVVIGGVKGLLIDTYDWARNYNGYIPIIDDGAKALLNIKNWGDPDHWFW